MPTKTKAGFVGAVVVVVILAIQSIERWTIVDAVLLGLRANHAGLMADILTSRIFPLVVAIAAICLVIEGRKERAELKSLDDHPRASLKVKESLNPKQELNQSGIHIPININPQIPAPPIKSSLPALKRKPNIEFLQPRVAFLDFISDREGSGDFVEIDKKTPLNAVLALFRNNVGTNVQAVYQATISLRFFADSKIEIGEGVSGALWLDSNHDEFDLTPGGATGRVVVLTLQEGKFMVPWEKTTHGNWMGSGLKTDVFLLPMCPRFIEVNLLDSNDQLVYQGFIVVTMEGNELKAAITNRAYWP